MITSYLQNFSLALPLRPPLPSRRFNWCALPPIERTHRPSPISPPPRSFRQFSWHSPSLHPKELHQTIGALTQSVFLPGSKQVDIFPALPPLPSPLPLFTTDNSGCLLSHRQIPTPNTFSAFFPRSAPSPHSALRLALPQYPVFDGVA